MKGSYLVQRSLTGNFEEGYKEHGYPVSFKIHDGKFAVLQDNRLVVHGTKEELWILYSTACKRGVPTKERQRKFMCSGGTILEFQNYLIAQDQDRVKFWDIASDSEEPVFTTDEM